jgi:hypothetical protein
MGHLLSTRSLRREHRWPLVGLVILLALLGHDALMATGAHAARGPRHTGHHARASDLQTPSDYELAATSTGCGMVATATFQDSASLRRALLAGGDVWDGSTTERVNLVGTRPLDDRSPDPTPPPGVRRALLQVFLI